MKHWLLFLMVTLPSVFGALRAQEQSFTSIQEALANPDMVLELVLNGQNLRELPVEIQQFKNLQKLDLWQNKLATLPDWIGKLSKLEQLIVKDNQLTELPAQLADLSALQFLDVSNNKLVAFPAGLEKLKKLYTLDASWNYLQASDVASICKITVLEDLNLEHNEKIGSLPDNLGALKSLYVLNLRFIGISTVPGSIGSMKQLEELNLAENELKSLPAEMAKLSALTEIDLSRTGIPDSELAKLPKKAEVLK